MGDKFIWEINGVEVEREDAYLCNHRDIELRKLSLAVRHNVEVGDISIRYEACIKEGV